MAKGKGCYRCGSDEGSETKLCPTCTQIRLVTRENPRVEDIKPSHASRSARVKNAKRSTKNVLLSRILVLYVGAGIILLLFALRAAKTYMRAEIDMEVSRKYSHVRCLDTVRRLSNEELIKIGGPEKICSILIEECEQDKYSERCKAARDFVLGESKPEIMIKLLQN